MKTITFLRKWPTLYDAHTRLDIHSAAKDDITWLDMPSIMTVTLLCWKIRSVASTEQGDNNDKMDRMWKESTVEYFKVLGNYTYLHKLRAQV
jgi:hypothetical protein